MEGEGGGGGEEEKNTGEKRNSLCACDCYGLALSSFMARPNLCSPLCGRFLLSQFEESTVFDFCFEEEKVHTSDPLFALRLSVYETETMVAVSRIRFREVTFHQTGGDGC